MKECGLPALVKKDNTTILEWINNIFNYKLPSGFIHFDVAKKLKTPQEKEIFFEDFFSTEKISSHNFWPFIRYIQSENKFKFENEFEFYIEAKERPITYASHMDSLIYSYYSFQLKSYYDKQLNLHKLNKSILAYRSIPNKNNKGKNNIDFAQ